MPDIELTSVFARPKSRAKAEALAKEWNIPQVWTDYAQLLAEDAADFVYVGLVNTVHYEYAKQALEAGKNVIIEKPFAPTYEEVKELIDLAAAKHCMILEAVTLLYLPNFRAMQDALAQLGPIRAVQANYSQYSSRYDKYLAGMVLPAFDPAMAGGALYDINIYNLNLICGLFGALLSLQRLSAQRIRRAAAWPSCRASGAGWSSRVRRTNCRASPFMRTARTASSNRIVTRTAW